MSAYLDHQIELTRQLTPHKIVRALDEHVIGQQDAKRAVAVALRNRYRRQQVEESFRDEIIPKNLLLVGPTGVGKTEIARRLAKLVGAPFIKVEATKFTEIGYVGKDVESIIRDLMEFAIQAQREDDRQRFEQVGKQNALESLAKILCGDTATQETLNLFKKKILSGELDNKVIEVELSQETKGTSLDYDSILGGGAGFVGGSLQDLFSSLGGASKKKEKVTVAQALKALTLEEADKLTSAQDQAERAKDAVENLGIVFLDEIDKLCNHADTHSQRGVVSREGVQRDLLPLIEGCVVSTKYGLVKTDHILFIASGAFQLSKPSDLLPELQGRLPIRVEMNELTQNDFERILVEPSNSLIRQYTALLDVDHVALTFEPEVIPLMAQLAVELNHKVENIGARRLHYIVEVLLADVLFEAPSERLGAYSVDKTLFNRVFGEILQEENYRKYIL